MRFDRQESPMARERARHRRQGNDDAVFAATPIDLTRPEDAKYAATIIQMSKQKSKTAWDWYDKLGEIHYGVSRSAKVGGYAELGVYRLNKDGSIGKQVTSGLPGEIAASLYSPYGGQRGLVERFLTLMKVPADSFLIQMMNEGQPDGYDFVSADELKVVDPTALLDGRSGTSIERVTLPAKSRWNETEVGERIAAAEFIGRVWRPSSRFVDMPDSPMSALDGMCDMLNLLTVGLRSKLMSRLASNGVFYVPNEVNDAKSAAPSGQPGEYHQNKVLNELINAAVYSARNPQAPEAAMPIFMTGPGIHAEQFKHIIMDQQVYETDMKLRNELIDRILTGLDVQPSQVKGTQDANHWSAWSASEDELRVSVRPDLETMCWALTRLVLWKQLQDKGFTQGRIQSHVVWFDLSRAQSHQNIAEDARQLSDRILLGPAATRLASGFEERDAPTDDEYIRAVGVALKIPYLATWGMTQTEKFDWEKIAPSPKTGPAPDSQAPDSKVQPGKGNPGSPNPADRGTKTPARLRPA
jgi:hypothetical protein